MIYITLPSDKVNKHISALNLVNFPEIAAYLFLIPHTEASKGAQVIQT